MIRLNWRLERHYVEGHYTYDYSKANFKGLETHIYNSNLLDCLISQIVDLVWSKISSTIIISLDLIVPKFGFSSHQYPKWFWLKCLYALRRKCRHSPSVYNYEHLHIAEVQFQQEVNDSNTSRSNLKLLCP